MPGVPDKAGVDMVTLYPNWDDPLRGPIKAVEIEKPTWEARGHGGIVRPCRVCRTQRVCSGFIYNGKGNRSVGYFCCDDCAVRLGFRW